MMHDFAITETKALFLDLNVAYDFALLEQGAPMPLRWHDDRTARIGVTPRHRGPTRWVEVEPCFVQHVINAYDATPDIVVLDVVRYPSFLRFDENTRGYDPNPLGVAWRYTIDLSSDHGTVAETQLDDRSIELPRINEAWVGRAARFTYAVEQPTDVEMRGIIKYDLLNGTTQQHRVPFGDQNSEPIFVPRPGGTTEDDGWVIACVYRGRTDSTDVVVLDAGDIASVPVAVVHLPCRVPAGFHGAWVNGQFGVHREARRSTGSERRR